MKEKDFRLAEPSVFKRFRETTGASETSCQSADRPGHDDP